MWLVQYIAATFALIGLMGVRKKQVWGPSVASLASFFWIMYGIDTAQWGLIAAESVYFCMYISIIIEWRKTYYGN